MSRQHLDRKDRRGDPTSPQTLNEFRREMRRNKAVVPPGAQALQRPGGMFVQPGKGGRAATIHKAKNGASILSPGATGTFTLFASIVSTSPASTTKDAVNGPVPIPANSIVWLLEQGGLVAVLGFWCP